MGSANLTREETAARSAEITLHTARVELDLTGAPEPAAAGFGTISTLEFDATSERTWIDFIGLAVDRVIVNGVDQAVRYDGARVLLSGLAASNTVRIEATAAYSRSGEGLHRFRDPVDDATYLYTQYEPADARRVMACFEQPDMKARYAFVVHAPEGWRVLSNQTPSRTAHDTGAQTVEFAPTLPISSYITAVAAGPYQRVESVWTRGDLVVPLGVLCRASLAQHLDAEEIFEITRQGLDFYADTFEYPYPWGKYDQIFVPEYNLGAMENPGLVTFTEALVFRGASTHAQHERRANTILHEMAHMWFGDLVTMRWWDDLWLKESFADYMGAHAATAATRFTDAWVTFANRRKAWAYVQDQLPTTHPIVADISDLEAAKLNFDGITYAKGAAVLKQLVAFVGEKAFFEGVRRYFTSHAFGSTTLADLLEQLERASGRDLRAWSRAWLETSGVTTLSLAPDGSEVVQSDPRPHRLAVGVYEFVGERLVRRERRELDVVEARTPILPSDAALVLLNDGDLSYAKVRLDERSLATTEAALSTIEDPLARGLAWSALWNATRDGELPAARFVRIARHHAPAEPDVDLLASALANAQFAIRHYVREPDRDAAQAEWLAAVWQGMIGAPPGSDSQLVWARAVGVSGGYDDSHADGIRRILDGTDAKPAGLPLDADLRWSWLLALSATGHADTPVIDAELRRDDTAAGRTAHIAVLAARPDPTVRAAAWRAAFEDLSLTNDHLDATIAGCRAGDRRDLITGFDQEYFSRIATVWQDRSIEIARRLVVGMFPVSPSIEPASTWLAENSTAPAALRRLIVEQLDHLERDLRVRAAQPR